MRPIKSIVPKILLLTACLLSVWRFSLGRWIQPALFGESNYQANRIRIESYLARPIAPKLVLVGSSLTGRLIPQSIASDNSFTVENLGLDGATALAGLSILTNRHDLPDIVAIETYALNLPPMANDSLLIDTPNQPGMRLAQLDPIFQSAYRPTALLYDKLKRRPSTHPSPSPPATHDSSTPTSLFIPLAPPTDVPQIQKEPVVPNPSLPAAASIVSHLLTQGVRVVLVDIPRGDTTPPTKLTTPSTSSTSDIAPRYDPADSLARIHNLPRIDLRRAIGHNGWTPAYTDGIHLDAASAHQVTTWLIDTLRQLPHNPPSNRP